MSIFRDWCEMSFETSAIPTRDLDFDWETCGVLSSIKEQSAEIDAAVAHSFEVRGTRMLVKAISTCSALAIRA